MIKVTKIVAEKERPLTMAETEAYAQFEASDRAGHVVFHPQVAPGKPAPDAVAFLKDFTRLAITYVPDRYRVQGDRWSRLEDDGKETPIDDNPLELAWHAAMAVKSRIEQGRDRGAWVVPVAVFVNMEPDDGIREAEAQSGSRVLFGRCDHVEALVSVLGKRDLQYPLTGRDIAEEVTALSRQSEATDPEPAHRVRGPGRRGPPPRHTQGGHQDRHRQHLRYRRRSGWRRGRLADHRSAAVAAYQVLTSLTDSDGPADRSRCALERPYPHRLEGATAAAALRIDRWSSDRPFRPHRT